MTDEYALGLIAQAKLEWQTHPHGAGGFVSVMNGVSLHLRGDSLTIAKGFKTITIRQPVHPVWKGPTPVETLLKEICSQAAKQCLEHYSEEYQKRLRDELLGELAGFSKRQEE